jgi:SAM-dependent methyltransferase
MLVENLEYPPFVARFYDPIYASLRSGVDHDYFLQEMRAADGPVLEVGVGTGRMFCDALESGVDIFGIDVSETMLSVLRGKLTAEEQSRVRLRDVRNLDLGRTFALIVAPFRVFSHLLTVDDQLAALNAVADHLADRGRFVFDLFSPNYGLLAQPSVRHLDFDGEHGRGESLRRFSSTRNYPASQVNLVTFDYEWTEQGQTHQQSWSFPMRYYFRYELEHLVARSRLELVDIFGDYDGGPITDETRDFVIVCCRCATPSNL